MPDVFHRRDFDFYAEIRKTRLSGRAAVRRALTVGAMLALAGFATPAESPAQTGKAAVKGKPSIKPEDLYGEQGGERVVPANSKVPSTVMRARRDDTIYRISNPRIDEKRRALLFDFEVVSRGEFNGGSLVMRSEDGGRADVTLESIAGQDSGTIQLVGVKQFGSLKIRTKTTFPEDVEMYVIRIDDRYEPPLKCMVSNPVTMGKAKTTSIARDWTPQEIARYTRPPLAYKNANANADIGIDVPSLAGAGGKEMRYVDPDGPLLGLDYHVGDWDNRKTLWRLAPVYSADQPKQHSGRSLARKGYAVAGAEVNNDKYVCGIRLLFGRIKSDGTLDQKDAYAGDWIGVPAEKPDKLVADGRRVLGINFHHGAIIDRFALVAEDKAQ